MRLAGPGIPGDLADAHIAGGRTVAGAGELGKVLELSEHPERAAEGSDNRLQGPHPTIRQRRSSVGRCALSQRDTEALK